MVIFSIEEWEKNFDELFKRVEEGETIGIVKKDGQAAVMMPADDELVRIHTENNNCLLYTSPSPRDATLSRMPSSA